MRSVIGWFLVGVLVVVLIYIIGSNIRRAIAKLTKKESQYGIDKCEEEYIRQIEYNRAHLPSTELPPLAPDWIAIDEFILETRFWFIDEGYRFAYLALVNNFYETRYILKSDFGSDSLKLIEMLCKDVNWFYENPTGVTLGEQDNILTEFLKEKYSRLSESSISRIESTFCTNSVF